MNFYLEFPSLLSLYIIFPPPVLRWTVHKFILTNICCPCVLLKKKASRIEKRNKATHVGDIN